MLIKNKLYKKDIEYICNFKLPYKNLDNKNILITGANGLIASVLVDSIMNLNLSYNYKINVYILCRNKEKAKKRFCDYYNDKRFNVIVQDVCESFDFNIDFSYIIHAASNAHPSAFIQDPVGTIKTNVLGTLNILNYINRKCPSARYLFLSTGEIYGKGFKEKQIFDENVYGAIDPLDFRSCYPMSKKMSENLCISYIKQYGLDCVIARLCYIYGASITDSNDRADAQFLRNVLNNENIILKSKGEQLRSYCYVADAVTALLTIMLKGNKGEAYNIANKSSNKTIFEYANIMANISGTKIVLNENITQKEKSGFSKLSYAVLDPRKLEELNWMAAYNIKDGLERTIEIAKDDLIGN